VELEGFLLNRVVIMLVQQRRSRVNMAYGKVSGAVLFGVIFRLGYSFFRAAFRVLVAFVASTWGGLQRAAWFVLLSLFQFHFLSMACELR